jgi:23S rRNA (guanosine2251-2'-O)-methyltransferase
VLAAAEASGRPPLVVLLDGVEDPHNLGAVVRSAHALGAHGVVLPRDRAAGVTPAAAKASAGAVEHVAIVRVTNLVRALEELKEAGLWAVGAVPEGERDIASVDLRGPTALVLGGEGQGIRPLVQRTCDHLVRIPMLGRVGSLNASAAAAIALYEAVRQRAETAGKKPP